MNDRILELARQAGLKKEHASDREYIGDFDWREYTRLIVQECVSMAKGYELALGRDNQLSNAMREHFGVKQ